MSFTTDNTIRDIALQHPETIRVFERFGIDYCCGGRKSLGQACQELQLSAEQLLQKLRETSSAPATQETAKWQIEPLSALVRHIVDKHHGYCRQEIPRLKALAEKVRARHGENHPELKEMETAFSALAGELNTHMLKEEQVLFPQIVRVECAVGAGQAPPPAFFGSIANPITAMVDEHEAAGELLAQLRSLSSDYRTPEGACPSYMGLFQGLKDFEQDLHMHVHLENNVLFPRAVEMESAKV